VRVIAGAFALAVVLLVENSAVWRSTSGVFDEPFFLRLAGEAIHDRRFDAFVHGWTAPLPVFAAYTLPAIVSGPGHVDVERFASLITLARVEHALTIGVPLILVVYVWLARRRGILVALVGGGLLVLSPLIVAHTSVATTDASLALTSLLALAALASYQARPSPSRWLLVGVALGCALSAKYSAAFLVPVAAAALLSALYPARSLVVATRLIGTLVGWLLVALLIAWAFHLFQVAPLLSPTAVPRDYQRLFGSGRLATMGLDVGRHVLVPLPLKAMQRLWEHGRTGHPAFLNGETSTHGWWRYFPLAFAMKSTPAELVMLLVVAFAMLWARRPRDRWQSTRRSRPRVPSTSGFATSSFCIRCSSSRLSTRSPRGQPADDGSRSSRSRSSRRKRSAPSRSPRTTSATSMHSSADRPKDIATSSILTSTGDRTFPP
jgi:hypothetical protein